MSRKSKFVNFWLIWNNYNKQQSKRKKNDFENVEILFEQMLIFAHYVVLNWKNLFKNIINQFVTLFFLTINYFSKFQTITFVLFKNINTFAIFNLNLSIILHKILSIWRIVLKTRKFKNLKALLKNDKNCDVEKKFTKHIEKILIFKFTNVTTNKKFE